MIVLKGCPRCHGDLMLVTYMEDRSTNCLQCGYSRSLPPPAAPTPRFKMLGFDDDRRGAARRIRLALREGA